MKINIKIYLIYIESIYLGKFVFDAEVAIIIIVNIVVNQQFDYLVYFSTRSKY